jgi:tetratricopeptide (TPR) repeat protein
MNDALRLAPDQGEVRVMMSVILDATGHYEDAADEARKAISLQPNNDNAHRLLGDVLRKLRKSDEAVAEYQEAIRIRPGYWRNHASLGVAYFAQGRNDEAIETFRRVTEIQPDSAWGFQQLGTAYHAKGDLGAALINYGKAIERGATARAHSNIGMIHYTRRNFEEAAHAFEQALTLENKNPRTWRNLGDTYLRLKRPDDSRKSYLQAVRLATAQLAVNPKDASLLALQGLCEAKLGRHADANRALRRAVDLRPDDNDVVYKLAVAQALAGRKSEALANLKKALDLKYPPYVVQTDDDLESLRKTPEFKRLLADKG